VPPGIEVRLRRITSRQNTAIRELRHCFSQAEPSSTGAVAVEGIRIIEEAIRSGLHIEMIFVRESSQKAAEKLIPQLSSHTEALLLPDDVFAGAVNTESPQGVAALVRLKSTNLERLMEIAGTSLLMIGAAGLQDPGNLGTIIRSAEAFGANAVLLGEKTVSHFNPKVIRASAGSIFREPVVPVKMRDTIRALRERQVRVVVTSSHTGVALPAADLTGPCLILIGNEGAGVPQEFLSGADEHIVIPHSDRVESLNAGIAGSIILYEAARQRSKTSLTNER
jgi:TrmH family RNA methyltransferase